MTPPSSAADRPGQPGAGYRAVAPRRPRPTGCAPRWSTSPGPPLGPRTTAHRPGADRRRPPWPARPPAVGGDPRRDAMRRRRRRRRSCPPPSGRPAAAPGATSVPAIGVGLSLAARHRRVPAASGARRSSAVVTAAVLVGVVELTRALRAGALPAAAGPAARRRAGDEGLAWTRGADRPGGRLPAHRRSPSCCGGSPTGPAGYLRDASAGVLVALYVPLLAGFAVLLARPRRRRRAGCWPSSRRSWPATSAGTRPVCCSASTRWRRPSARRSPGRAWPAR